VSIGLSSGSRPRFIVPAAGKKAIFFSNSKCDNAGGLGQWCDTLCNYFSWIPVNRNQVAVGGFELTANGTLQTTAGGNAATNVGWQVSGTGGQLLRESTTVFAGAGSGELLCATVGGGSVSASPYNPATITWGGDTAAFAGGMRCGLVAGRSYTVSGAFWTNGPANSVISQVRYKIGAGGATTAAFNVGGFVPNDSAWHAQAGTGTIPATATEAWLEIIFNPTTNTTFLLFDNIQIEPFCGGMTSGVATAYADYYTRAAISGSYWQSNGAGPVGFAAPYNAVTSAAPLGIAARCTSFAPDIVFVEYNMNDLYLTGTPGAGSPAPTTTATWRTNMHANLAAIQTALPNAKVVVLGCSNTIFPFASGVYPFGAPGLSAAIGTMDNITRQEVGALGANFLFVPIFPKMPSDFCSPLTNDGKHPSRPQGMQLIADIVAQALEEGVA
jgi:lysophospholipase L1-like esterase